MSEMGRLFRRHMVLRGFAEATKESYEYAMADLARAYGGTPPEGLNCAQVQAHLARLADGNAPKRMTLSCAEFVGRFLLHVLPPGFQKVRAGPAA